MPDIESKRLRRLHSLGLLDTGAEEVLDTFTRLATNLTGLPIGLISLIDQDRQWFKSAIGLLQGTQTPRSVSFCSHAIKGDSVFEVMDARRDPRFADNPLVRGPPYVIHYAGAPLIMPGGEHIGTLCVISDQPGQLAPQHRVLLEELAAGVVRVLLLRESERDLSARVRAEMALRDSEARFNTITDAMPQMVWSALPDGRFDYFNQRWHDFTGTPPGGCELQTWLARHHPDEQERVEGAWRHSLTTGEPLELESRLCHHGGEYHWILTRALPVRDSEGEIVRWMGTCTDIQEHKRVQEELEQAGRRKDEFLAMLAHELRNPLAPVSTAAHLLQLAADDPQRVRQYSELITRQVGHMTEMVDDLLDVSRVTRGLVRIEHERVDLRQVVHDAVEQARPQIDARRQALCLQVEPQPVLVMGDRVRLVQVLANLLSNSTKYTPERGHITVFMGAEGSQAVLRVIDDGCGIEPSLLPHVFELFTQARRTPDRAQGGLGVGLALVRSLVDLHGGHAQVDSAGLGQGTCVTVRLPRAQDLPLRQTDSQAPAPAAAPAPLAPASSGLRILVVDDNTDAGRLLGMWLEAMGHRVCVKSDAREALAAASQERFDVYVLDIGLPGMDGNELARRLRQDPRNRRAMLIALTGYGQAHDMLQSRQAGFDHHFVKPADPQRLEAALAALAVPA